MQQCKKRIRVFFDFEKKRKSNNMLSFRDHSISFFPVCIELLRPYFNQQFFIMLYVYVFVSERTV